MAMSSRFGTVFSSCRRTFFDCFLMVSMNSGTLHPEFCIIFAMARSLGLSSCVKYVIALPRLPARPVRPIL